MAVRTTTAARHAAIRTVKATPKTTKKSDSASSSKTNAEKAIRSALKSVQKSAKSTVTAVSKQSRMIQSVRRDTFTKTGALQKTGIYSATTVYSKSAASGRATQAQIDNAVMSLAARNAGISTTSNGTPIINNAPDAKRYADELNRLKGSEDRIKAAKAAGVNVDSYGNPRINSASDAKSYLDEYENIKMNKFKKYGINIDEIQMNTNSEVKSAKLTYGKSYTVGSNGGNNSITEEEYVYLVATIAGEAGGVSTTNAFGCASAFINNWENNYSDKSIKDLLSEACWKWDERNPKGYEIYIESNSCKLTTNPKYAEHIKNAKNAVDATLNGYRAFDKDVTNWVGNGEYNKFSTTWKESSNF